MADRVISLRPADAPWLARLHGEAFERPWSEEALRADLAQHTVLGLAVKAANKDEASLHVPASAFVLVSIVPPESEILTLAVAPHARRRGHARQLLHMAMKRLAERGATRLFLEVAEDNFPAQALYQGLGFEIEGRRTRYYQRLDGKAVDALLMSRAISGQTGL